MASTTLLVDNSKKILERLQSAHKRQTNALDKQLAEQKEALQKEHVNFEKQHKAELKTQLAGAEKSLAIELRDYEQTAQEQLSAHFETIVSRILASLPAALEALDKKEQENLLELWYSELEGEADAKATTIRVPKGLSIEGVKCKDDLPEFGVIIETKEGVIYTKTARQVVMARQAEFAELVLGDLNKK